MGMTLKLEFDIGELSLDGFSNIDGKSLGAIIEMELTKLLKEPGSHSNFSSNTIIKQLDFGTFNLVPNSGPQTLGRQIAKTIYTGFNQGRVHSPQAKEAQTRVQTPTNN